MIDHMFPTVNQGVVEVQDRSDDPSLTVSLWIGMYPQAAASPQMPWAYSIDGVRSSWQSFNLQPVTTWQHLGLVYVGYARQFIFHLGATGNPYVGGPADFTVDLFAGSNTKTVSLKVGDQWKKAIPFVNVNGVWKPVEPWAMSAGTWKPTS